MGVRSRLATALTTVAKTFGTAVPGAIQAAEVAAGMGPTKPFSPGEPIGPYDGYSRTPRTHDFTTGYNIATRPRTHERVSFDTLRGLVESYDVAQMCIWHRIDSIRSLDWSLVAADGHDGDVSNEIKTGLQILAKPDGQQPFASWIASWLYDVLAYDAGTLYRLRNRGGRCIGLRVVDGTTIAPLLDYWGNPPEAPAEAFVQYANGLPWNWLTRDDLIYTPFRKRPNSVYGTAPLESILLNANTDLRFQAYFLQRFTEGNIPEAFASAPETWTPQQIEDFQTYWDALMLGDQAGKHQIRWMPGGSSIAWSNEKDFTDGFSLFLMRKTAAAYHVVPADLGFTENVNRSSGESQADVQHRVGDLPLIRHIQHVLTGFLQDDLRLPVKFAFDLGEEQVDQLAQAQADKIYAELGAISSTTLRELRYGLNEPDGIPVPRFIASTRSGPIPLSALYGVAGQVDPATAAPEPGAPLPHTAFAGVEGTEPSPPLITEPLAEQIYGPSALPPLPPGQQPAPGQPVAKDGAPAPGPPAGITADTGITGYDLIARDDEDDEPGDEELVKAELAAFRKFRKARRRAGQWRDFEFRHIGREAGAQLNADGRATVQKATAGKGDAPAKGAHWPGWGLDEQCAEYWTPRVIQALTGASGALAGVLTGVHTDAYLIGLASAQAVTDGGRPKIGSWTPGDTNTARQLIESLGGLDGLAEVLESVPEEASSIADDVLKFHDGEVTKSKPSDELRDKIASRARRTAVTAITRISGKAALWWYRLRGIRNGRWLLDPNSSGCPVCDMNAAAGPVPLGKAYPSGDALPPAHPNCRCAVVAA